MWPRTWLLLLEIGIFSNGFSTGSNLVEGSYGFVALSVLGFAVCLQAYKEELLK